MGKRHEAIGIKQVVRLEWYDYALEMLLEGRSSKQIREQLDEFIRERLQSGGYGARGEQTYTKAVTQIMKCWVSPSLDLVEFRNSALSYARENSRDARLFLHWAVTIAAYPFWYRVAEQVGRLLSLQDTISQGQIRLRCFEAMGERSTIERSARRVIRSYVAWGVLKDAENKGCYKKAESFDVLDPSLAVLLLEAALLATRDGKGPISLLLNNPAFFPFRLPLLTGDGVALRSGRIEVVRYGLDDELLQLKRNHSGSPAFGAI